MILPWYCTWWYTCTCSMNYLCYIISHWLVSKYDLYIPATKQNTCYPWLQNISYPWLQNTSYSWLQNAFYPWLQNTSYPWLQNTSFPITVDFDNDQTKIIQKLSVHIKFAINLCVLTLKLYNVGNNLINCTQRWVIFILSVHG